MIKRQNIYVDAWVSGNPGRGGWRGLLDDNEVIFNRRPKSEITNNIGEFFAIIDAIKWIKENAPEEKFFIWSDSITAISWFQKRKVKTNSKSKIVLELISRTEKYLNNVDMENIIIKKWNTKTKGEIPADFGRK